MDEKNKLWEIIDDEIKSQIHDNESVTSYVYEHGIIGLRYHKIESGIHKAALIGCLPFSLSYKLPENTLRLVIKGLVEYLRENADMEI